VTQPRLVIAGGARGLLPTGPSASRRRMPRWRKTEALTGWLFVSLPIVLFVVFGAYTIGYGFALSFASWNGLSPNWTWLGLGNYQAIFGGRGYVAKQLSDAFWVTLILTISVPVLTVAISFPIALMLNSVRRVKSLLRTIYFLPYVTAGIAVVYAWRYVFDVDGALNTVLRAVGLGILAPKDGLLGSSATALIGVIVLMVWAGVPLGILLYLTGLQTLDQSLFEAAAVDGAGRFQTSWHIVWPMLRPTTALLIILNLKNAMQDFVTPMLMTNGGPFRSTTPLGLVAYNFAFGALKNLGYASALGWLLFAAGLILALINLRAGRRRD